MFQDITLFEREAKTELITIRVTKSEKERISQMAGAKGISAFILSLVGQEHERQINQERKMYTAKVLDIFDDDGMPF